MYLRIVGGALRRNRGRAVVALAAIIVPTALVAAVTNFVLDARARLGAELRGRGANVVLAGDLDAAILSALPAGTRHLRSAAWVEDGVAVVGLQGDREALRAGWRLDGAWPSAGEVLPGVRLAERLRVATGGMLLGRRVSGLVETGDDDDLKAFVSLDRPATRTELSVPGGVEEVERVAAMLPGARVQRALAATEAGLLDRLTRVFLFAGTFTLGISALSMATALTAAVSERRREIGLLKALGASDVGVMRLLAGELLAVVTLGLAAGALLGLGLAAYLTHAVFGLTVRIRPGAVLAALLASGVIAAAGALVAMRRALAVEPALVLRDE